ncbi:DUF7619 domain-containing protein [Pontibacter oryzae]|uniref:T9SS C-terminal target domain-containing protein n=1 Tax=Pontibacter oryzae TaxID=2304593 RepID=A0A399SF38_9BACT|nr:IPT/TIG domain-containing protein [Pontibacter oryzae]RIJ41429.1 T9SS C-terminal target domain-containing protein [Pontibacter oryzae]
MRTALLLTLTITLFILCYGHALHAQNSSAGANHVIGNKLLTPEGVLVSSSGNLYIANRYHVRILDSEGNFIKDAINTAYPKVGQYRSIAFDQEENLFVWNAIDGILTKYNKSGDKLFEARHTISYYSSSVVEGMAIDPDGYIYIARANENKIWKFDPNGNYLFSFENVKTPGAIAIDPNGFILVANTGNNEITKFNSSGELIAIITKPGSESQPFIKLSGLAVGKDGKIYAADSGNATVYAFDENGQLSYKVKLTGVMSEEHIGIGLDHAGNAFITTSGSLSFQLSHGNLLKINPNGTQVDYLISNNIQDNILISGQAITNDGLYSLLSDGFTKQIQVYNNQGMKVWSFGKNGPGSSFDHPIENITVGPDNSIYVLHGIETAQIQRYTPTGKFISAFDETFNNREARLKFGLDNYLYVYKNGSLLKYTPEGKYLTSINISDYNDSYTYPDFAVDEQGSIYLVKYRFGPEPFTYTYQLFKYSNMGEFLFEFDFSSLGRFSESRVQSVSVAKDGKVYTAGSVVKIFDTEGKSVGFLPYLGDRIVTSADGSAVLVGYFQKRQLTVFNRASSGKFNTVTGTVFHDVDLSGNLTAQDIMLPNIIVKAEPGPYFGKTDLQGKYSIDVRENGSYEVEQILPKATGMEIQQLNPANALPNNVNFKEQGSRVSDVNFANQVTLSPYLSVSLSSTRRRRCFESTTSLNYNNKGYAPVSNAKVYLQLPEQVELLSADKPFTQLANGTYVFEVGTLAAGTSGTVTIQDKVKCGDESFRGMTVCTKAWITPPNNYTPPATWDQSEIRVSGRCFYNDGTARFVLKNMGQGNMKDSLQLRVYQDATLAMVQKYRLAAADSMVLRVPAQGRTIRVEADQAAGHPTQTFASATVEACRVIANRVPFSTGFVNAMPTSDEAPEVAEECLTILDSYDPNDKLVSPVGLTEANYTATGTALKYKIRFQNTGSDVAYRVVVVDTLSEHLDLSTLQVGAASHTYRFNVSGKGKPVLTWTFDNIMLPDSTSNEPGSHGYIQFSIKPKADLAEKSSVENFADIFFDFNSPVRTNTTVNRIFDMPLEINEEAKLNAGQVIASPSISGFAPAAGKFGAEVILTGRKFAATAADNKVYFNGVAATVLSATAAELKVLVPTASISGTVKVLTPDGSASSSDAFEVYQPPVITSFSPIEGIAGANVTLQGQHLNPALLESIKLGSHACELISNDGQSLVVKVPAQATTGTFELATKGGKTSTSNAFVVWQQPGITGFSSPRAKVGATLQISGQNFAADAARNNVYFGTAEAQVLAATTTQLTLAVPAGATSGNITVHTPGGTATSAIAFEVIPAPSITSFNPARGSVGSVVEITGLNFGVLQVQDEISFNGTKALVLAASDTKYKVQVPRGAATGKISMYGIGGEASSATDFKVEESSPTESVELYPNPTTGLVTLSFVHADFDLQKLHVFSATGSLVQTMALPQPRPEKLEVNLETAKPGVYLLQLQTDRGLIVKKLTIL